MNLTPPQLRTGSLEDEPLSKTRLGVRENGSQIAMILLTVVFIGAVVGVERSVLPLLAKSEFGLTSATVSISFLAAFGLTKALANLLAGDLAGLPGSSALRSPKSVTS